MTNTRIGIRISKARLTQNQAGLFPRVTSLGMLIGRSYSFLTLMGVQSHLFVQHLMVKDPSSFLSMWNRV